MGLTTILIFACVAASFVICLIALKSTERRDALIMNTVILLVAVLYALLPQIRENFTISLIFALSVVGISLILFLCMRLRRKKKELENITIERKELATANRGSVATQKQENNCGNLQQTASSPVCPVSSEVFTPVTETAKSKSKRVSGSVESYYAEANNKKNSSQFAPEPFNVNIAKNREQSVVSQQYQRYQESGSYDFESDDFQKSQQEEIVKSITAPILNLPEIDNASQKENFSLQNEIPDSSTYLSDNVFVPMNPTPNPRIQQSEEGVHKKEAYQVSEDPTPLQISQSESAEDSYQLQDESFEVSSQQPDEFDQEVFISSSSVEETEQEAVSGDLALAADDRVVLSDNQISSEVEEKSEQDLMEIGVPVIPHKKIIIPSKSSSNQTAKKSQSEQTALYSSSSQTEKKATQKEETKNLSSGSLAKDVSAQKSQPLNAEERAEKCAATLQRAQTFKSLGNHKLAARFFVEAAELSVSRNEVKNLKFEALASYVKIGDKQKARSLLNELALSSVLTKSERVKLSAVEMMIGEEE